MGDDLGGGITAIEARWMRDREFAVTAEDALYRRSKLGVTMDESARAAFAAAWGRL